ncbi:MAG: choice-of-anchor tandem repeat GloVer-containing protein [Rhizomicrobium sp.]
MHSEMWQTTRRALGTGAIAAALGATCFAPSAPAYAHGYKVLYTFCRDVDCVDGANPSGGLVEDAAGNLYGTTVSGGTSSNCNQIACGYGVAFELKRTNSGYKYRVLYDFDAKGDDAADPGGSLIFDMAGNLYGVTEFGGSGNLGTVFELLRPKGKSPWTIRILYSFCSEDNCADGGYPSSGLTYAGAASGALYDGTSPLFGVTFGFGGEGITAPSTAYELVPGKSFQVLHTFGETEGDGAGADGPVVLDASGNLYGSTIQSETEFEGGVVYELSPSGGWTETLLHTFCETFPCTDGSTPESGLVIDPSGNLYGTTRYGGADCTPDGDVGCGVAFEVVPDGVNSQKTVLHAFCSTKHCGDRPNPAGPLVLDAQGNLFGTTAGYNLFEPKAGGDLFELSGSDFQVLNKFCKKANCADGFSPEGPIVRDPQGRTFGVTTYGGNGVSETYAGDGVAYDLVP